MLIGWGSVCTGAGAFDTVGVEAGAVCFVRRGTARFYGSFVPVLTRLLFIRSLLSRFNDWHEVRLVSDVQVKQLNLERSDPVLRGELIHCGRYGIGLSKRRDNALVLDNCVEQRTIG
jgi:hypothetical protein